MNSSFITKWQGAALSLLIMSPYVYTYYMYFGDNPYSVKLTTLFTFGVMLNFFQKIEPGTKAELVFFGKATGLFWSDGPVLVPTIFPFLHNIGVYLLWSLKKTYVKEHYKGDSGPDIYHMQDQRLARYNVNTQASLLSANFDRMISNILGWIIGFKRGDPELLYQRLGFRVMLLAIVLGFVTNTYSSVKNNQYVQSGISVASGIIDPISNFATSSHKGTVTVFVPLQQGPMPVFPSSTEWILAQDNSNEPYYVYDQAPDDLRPYYRFKESLDGNYPIRYVDRPLCQVIPQGMRMGFAGKLRPKHAVNMKNSAIYMKKGIFLTLPEKLARWVKNNTSYKKYDSMPAEDTLEGIYANWYLVDTDDYSVIMEARDQKDMPVGATVGIVCF